MIENFETHFRFLGHICYVLGRIAVLHTQMRPIVTNRVAWSVGLSVIVVSPAKTAEPIEMPFGLWTWVGSGKHVLDGGPNPTMGRDRVVP